MTVSAPITHDVFTIARKLLDGPMNLVGLTRAHMRDALIEHGTPAKQAKMRVGQIWQWIYEKGVRDFAVMSNLAKTYRAELGTLCDRGARGCFKTSLAGWDAQIPNADRRRA